MAGAATRVRSSGVHFAESHMADFLREDTLLIDPNGGPRKIADALAATAHRLGTDLTIFVDVGGDVLAHGDEPGLASPAVRLGACWPPRCGCSAPAIRCWARCSASAATAS